MSCWFGCFKVLFPDCSLAFCSFTDSTGLKSVKCTAIIASFPGTLICYTFAFSFLLRLGTRLTAIIAKLVIGGWKIRLVTQCVPLLCSSRTLPLYRSLWFLASDILLVYWVILSYYYTGMVVVLVLSIWVQCPVWGLSGVSLTVHSHWVMSRGHAPMAWMSG